MNFPLYIAQRYLVAKKSRNVINIISWVSVIGIAVGTAGLVIVLSVFNGFGDLVISLYNSFDPDVKITVVEGKTFDPADAKMEEIKKIKGVKAITLVLEESALLKYRERQVIATVKGVDENYSETSDVENNIVEGEMLLQKKDKNFAVPGGGIAYTLGMNLDDVFSSLNIYVPKRGREVMLAPENAFTNLLIQPSGIFSIQQDFDSKYVIVPLRFARDLIGEEAKVTALEISLTGSADPELLKIEIAKVAGSQFLVRNRIEQHDFLNKILVSEKWAVYLILSLILLISAFSIIGSLTMLIIDKKQDIAILLSMGADLNVIRKIFLTEGLMISLIGGVAGLIFGWLICLAQQTFSFIRFNENESFVVDAYPVSMQPLDFINVFIIVFVIGAALSWFSSYRLIKKEFVMEGKI
ncbi:MAG TPA: FtsX-like permease family protein [Bacteroidia bacterium]|nr:FtsX-like permease family protein [Bacteroidia bacterium]